MFYLFLFGCTGSLLLHGLSLVAVSRGYSFIAVPRASRCSGFSCCGTQAPESTGFSSCGSWALEYRLSSCGVWPYLLWGMWDLPTPGIEPVSIALQGGFFTTEPSGETQINIFLSLPFWKTTCNSIPHLPCLFNHLCWRPFQHQSIGLLLLSFQRRSPPPHLFDQGPVCGPLGPCYCSQQSCRYS